MKITKTLLLLLLAVSCARAQEPVPIVPLAPVDPVKVLTTAVAVQPHVLFVNVDKALEDALFREAVAAVALVMPVNLAVAEAQGFDGVNLFEKEVRDTRFSAQAKLAVYVANKPEVLSFISAPGRWALINVSGLDRDKPDAERYRRRLRQMMLKGLAQACGVGSTGDFRCVMYHKSFTLEGLDKTSVSYSPFAGGPVQDTLLEIGGMAIFRQPEASAP